MTSDFNVSPELVCSNSWAPGGVNTSDSCPTLPTAVLCKVLLLHARGGPTFPGEGKKGDTVWEGKVLFCWDCRREKTISLVIPAPVLDHPHPRKPWPFRFWEKLPPCGPFLVPLLVSYILSWCSKNRDTMQNFMTTLVAIFFKYTEHIPSADREWVVLLKVWLTSEFGPETSKKILSAYSQLHLAQTSHLWL